MKTKIYVSMKVRFINVREKLFSIFLLLKMKSQKILKLVLTVIAIKVSLNPISITETYSQQTPVVVSSRTNVTAAILPKLNEPIFRKNQNIRNEYTYLEVFRDLFHHGILIIFSNLAERNLTHSLYLKNSLFTDLHSRSYKEYAVLNGVTQMHADFLMTKYGGHLTQVAMDRAFKDAIPYVNPLVDFFEREQKLAYGSVIATGLYHYCHYIK